MLIEEYGCSLDRRNLKGWMAKDMIQHDSIQRVYQRFYRRLNNLFNQLQKSIEGPLTVSISDQADHIDEEALSNMGNE